MIRPRYRSSIPKNAKERVTERFADGAKKHAEYLVEGRVVGIRLFFETGEPELEYGLKDGKKHGMEYDWIEPGVLIFSEPHVNGLIHGTARQWDANGRFLGSYTMTRGTGVDLWRQQEEDGTITLSEVMHYKDGHFHGFEWWLNEDQKTVWREVHWRESSYHGIEREWNNQGRLSRGFPKYYVHGEKVSKRQYIRACKGDSTLPPFRPQDNKPVRRFPKEIARHLRR